MKRLVILIVFLMGLVAWFIHSSVEAEETTAAAPSELLAKDSSEMDSLTVDYKE